MIPEIKKKKKSKAGKTKTLKPKDLKKSKPSKPTSPAKRPKKSAPKKDKSTSRNRTTKKIPPTGEEVSIRAYFIAQHRETMGHHGDPHSDWIEAERQLSREAAQD